MNDLTSDSRVAIVVAMRRTYRTYRELARDTESADTRAFWTAEADKLAAAFTEIGREVQF